MNQWAIVMWDAELEEWYRRFADTKKSAHDEMIEWVREQFEAWELDCVMRMNDEQEIEFVNDEAKALAVVKNDTATIDIKCRERIEMFMFRTC